VRKVAAVAALAAVALLSTGCSGVTTGPDQVALHYEGGSVSSKKFKDCVPVSKREWNGPGDNHFVYPANQRTFDFTGAKGSDAERITVATKDSIQMSVPGLVRFTLNTDCEALREFHEKIGNRETAYFDDAAKPSSGWRRVLEQFIGRQIDATLDREALAYNWREIYTDPSAKARLDKAVAESLQELVNANTEGETQFFNILSVQLQKPEPPQELLDALASEQTKIAQANAAKAEAEAQIATAQAQERLARVNAEKLKADISGYGNADAYNKAKAIEKGINPYQPTYVVPQAQPAG
jgi:regulator of protease activity HflC (stomatin/prohibitin superfamily)